MIATLRTPPDTAVTSGRGPCLAGSSLQAKPQRYEQGKRKRNGRDFQAASKGAACSHRRRGFVSGPPLICRFAVARRIGVPQETEPVGWMDFIFPRRSNTRRSDPGNLPGRLGLLAAPFEGWGGVPDQRRTCNGVVFTTAPRSDNSHMRSTGFTLAAAYPQASQLAEMQSQPKSVKTAASWGEC